MENEKYEIRWTLNAFEAYERLYYDLLNEWSVDIAEKFRLKTEVRLYNLSYQPFIGRLSRKRRNIRSILISKYNRLYYRVAKDYIELVSIFDMRQNPSRNKFK